jgi:hypothetical protein
MRSECIAVIPVTFPPGRARLGHEYDRDGLRGVLGRHDRGRARCHEDIHFATDKLCRDVRELSGTQRQAVFDDEVLPLDVTVFTQPLQEALDPRLGGLTNAQETYPIHTATLLPFGAQWHGKSGDSTDDEGSPIHYSMT